MFIFISLVAQLILKQSLNKIVTLFVLMQSIIYLNELSLSTPAQIKMLYFEFKKLIEFQTLNFVKMVQLIDPDFTLEYLISKARVQIVNED